MASNNYYSYSFNNSSPSQYSTVTGSSGYATGAHAQHAIPVQSAYPPSQTTVQYGPYGTRSQVTSQSAAQMQAYEETSPRYFTHQGSSAGSSTDASYYSQKSKSHQPSSATYQSRTSHEQSYSTPSKAQNKVTSSEWQVQNKAASSQNYGSSYTSDQKHASSAAPVVEKYVTTAASSSQGYAASAAQSFGGNASSTTTPSPSSSAYSGLDAAVYSAATNYLMQKQRGGGSGGGGGGSWFRNFRGGSGGGGGSRGPPDPSQWKYCELCKCTCAGLQAYKAHLVGKAHKKKEVMAQSSVETKPGSAKGALGSHLYCQLCDVVCSSSDAHAAHLRGSKHQRILKLQIKMGKPIPAQESKATESAASETRAAAPPSAKIFKTTTTSGVVKKVYSTPKMTFVGGTQLQTTGVRMEEVSLKPTVVEQPQTSEDDPDFDDKNAQPVGLEYIEESMNETRTAPNFYCKLCDCSFTDPHAKVMHTKGRRHRLQYKKKVDPSLKVDMKMTSYGSRAEMERVKRRIAAGEYWRKKEIQDSYKLEAEDLRYEKELLQWQLEKTAMRFDSMSTSSGDMASVMVPPGEKFRLVEMGSKRDADHVLAKHAAIYPNEEDLKIVQNLVSTSERGLKLVSDHLATTKIERDLKGVMRVGMLAKGLLLHDSLDFELVVLCSCRPTQALLKEIMDHLPEQLKTFTEEAFHLAITEDGAGFTLQCITNGEVQQDITCTISLTSPAVSADSGKEVKEVKTEPDAMETDPDALKPDPDAFEVKPCLRSLAALRHAKWFQAKANNLFSCVIVIRIMMDFCKRVPTWSVVTQWSLELLVEKCISSDPAKMSPAIALRRVFEAVASGIFLTGGPGIYDPCEKTPSDAFDYLTRQEKEDLTNSAQHAVRLIAFGSIHKVLGMDPLPAPAAPNNKSNKRKLDSAS